MKFKIIKHLRKYIYPLWNYKGKAKVSPWIRGLQNFTFKGENIVPEFCVSAGKATIGYRTTLGVHNFLGGTIEIGKYCQIGGYVAFHASNHPINYPTTYINSSFFNGDLVKLKEDNPIKLGNDIWVGHAVIVLSGVTVGDGAILAAGAVVTKDVAPYTIVGGNPAKPIRKRFSDKIINELLELKWWDMTEEELEKVKPLFLTDLTKVDSIYTILKK